MGPMRPRGRAAATTPSFANQKRAVVQALCCDRASLGVLDDLVDSRDFLPIVDGLHHTGCPQAPGHRIEKNDYELNIYIYNRLGGSTSSHSLLGTSSS